MADKKITELTAIAGSATADTDLFVMVDADTGITKKITRAELNNAIALDVLDTVDINGGNIDGTIIGAATPAAGTFTALTANSGASVTGNITVSGNVDGRDVAADGTKLDGIESNATADQTGAEIATALNGETITSLTALTTTGALIVGGDLTVNGTTTTINSTTLTVDDKNIELASGAADAAAANGAGLTIDGATATFQYVATGDKWAVNKNFDVTGNIIVSGTVDGRDLQTDGTKLDGIESNATADQTAAEIRTLVESATDSNVFTDADHTKLNGIEASADVTDTANVTAAGALMDSEVSNLADVKSFNPADYATAAQGTLAANALPKSGGTMTGNIAMSGTETVDGRDVSVDGAKLDGIETGATADQTGAEIKAAYEGESDTNAFTDALLTKLNGIEASATADQTAAEIRTLVESATDSNVFTDADHTKLNGVAANATAVSDLTDLGISDGSNGQVLKTDGAGNFSFGNVGAGGSVAFSSITGLPTSLSGYGITDAVAQLADASSPNYQTPSSRRVDPNSDNPSNHHYAITTFGNGSNVTGQIAAHFQTGQLYSRGYNSSFSSWRTIWNDANDGSGSGLDADTVDGIQGSAFLRSDTADTASGKITMSTGIARNAHEVGHLEGGYNNVSASSTSSSPIFTIGSAYNPAASTLGNMYGIGYSHTNASFISFSGASGWGMYVAADGDARVYLGGSNGAISATGNITAYASDERLKTNVKAVENALDKVCKLRGVEFDWVDNITSEYDFHPISMHETGVLAQNVAEVIPDAVREAPFNGNYTQKCGTDHEFLTVDKEKIIPVLIEAIKELKSEAEGLKAEVVSLRAKVEDGNE